jgi:hypothetical protein
LERKATKLSKEKDKEEGNLIKYMSNPRAFTLRKWFYDLLKLNYIEHDPIIERVGTSLATQKDLEDFGKLIGQVYDIGYRKAVEDYKKEIEKLGLKVQVVAPDSAN